MRTESVTIAGNTVIIREKLIEEIEEQLLPKVEKAWEAIKARDIMGVISELADQAGEVFPELKGIDIRKCYPSEIEEFAEKWLDVNFSGLRRLIGPVLSLVVKEKPQQG
jgi:hypothetical protein